MAKDKKEKKDTKSSTDQDQKVWKEIRKEVRGKVSASLSEGWEAHKPTVVGMGTLGALLGVAISEGIWWTFAPGARGSIGHIVSDVAGGAAGASGGTAAGLYTARGQVRSTKASIQTESYMQMCQLAGIKDSDAKSLISSAKAEDLKKFYGALQCELIMQMAKDDPKEFRKFVEGVAAEIGSRVIFDGPIPKKPKKTQEEASV